MVAASRSSPRCISCSKTPSILSFGSSFAHAWQFRFVRCISLQAEVGWPHRLQVSLIVDPQRSASVYWMPWSCAEIEAAFPLARRGHRMVECRWKPSLALYQHRRHADSVALNKLCRISWASSCGSLVHLTVAGTRRVREGTKVEVLAVSNGCARGYDRKPELLSARAINRFVSSSRSGGTVPMIRWGGEQTSHCTSHARFLQLLLLSSTNELSCSCRHVEESTYSLICLCARVAVREFSL